MKLPPAVKKYMAEYGELEADVRAYILRQLEFYAAINEKASTTKGQWVGFKLGCTEKAANRAIEWAEASA